MTSTYRWSGRGSMSLDVTVPAPRTTWGELVAADPQALPTQSPEWLDCLCAGGRYVDASRLYETAQGGRAVLPMVLRAHTSGWTARYSSLPAAWGFGGLLSDVPLTADTVSAVVDDLADQRALRVYLRPNPLFADQWAAAMTGRRGVTRVPSRAHVLDLCGGFDAVWRHRFRSSTRTAVRRAEKSDVDVESGTSERLIYAFYQLLLTSTDRWARRQHEPVALARLRLSRRDPRTKFESIAASLGDACRIHVARVHGEPVAAILVLQGRNAHYTRGAMDQTLVGSTQATRLLHTIAIEDACRRGCASYHMGESGTSPGLAQFKSGFGAVAYPYEAIWIETVPLSRADRWFRRGVKRVIGFREDEP